MQIQELYQDYLKVRSVSIDTRKIISGTIFFCLHGQNNGNQYAQEALEKGASKVVMDDLELYNRLEDKSSVFLVKDSLKCLQELAIYHRNQLTIPVIGITGSNGKTTTKELIYSVLSEKFQVFATQGNLNNHIGVPLSILSILPEHEIAVIEMGANHQKEIAFLCTISQPSLGLITNIGKAHLEGFGGIEGIMKGKKELYDYLKENSKQVFIYSGDFRLLKMSEGIENKIYYGVNGNESVSGKVIQEFPYLEIAWKYSPALDYTHLAKTQLTGSYNLPNLLAGISMGKYFNLSPFEIQKGLEKYDPQNNRSQLKSLGSNQFILDYYNANPDSMLGALNNFIHYPSDRKMVILGDMNELGMDSNEEHQKILDFIENMNLKEKILIGPHFYSLRNSTKDFYFFEDTNSAVEFLKNRNPQQFTILIKGSRGIQLEKVLSFFNS